MFMFHKTEVQMVILRCLTGLNLDCFKSFDSKCKYFPFCFFPLLQKKESFVFFAFLGFFAFCVITVVPIMTQTCSVPQNDRLNLNFVKDIHIVCTKMDRNGRKMAICQM